MENQNEIDKLLAKARSAGSKKDYIEERGRDGVGEERAELEWAVMYRIRQIDKLQEEYKNLRKKYPDMEPIPFMEEN